MCYQKIKSFFCKDQKNIKPSVEVMDLSVFISDSLVAIVHGIKDAQSKIGANVSIEDEKYYKPLVAPNLIHGLEKHNFKMIDFDVAVTVINSSSDALKGKINVISAQINAELTSEKERSTVSRIKFSIPIIYPSMPNSNL